VTATGISAPGFVSGISLVIAPALFALSSFFWTGDGQYGATGGVTLVFGSLFWIAGLAGVFRALEPIAPRYASWGFLFAVYGAICGGVAFAFQGMFITLHGISHAQAMAVLGAHPTVANLVFWIGGPAFPLSLLVLGIVLARTGLTPAWAGVMLAAGGALFPVARIPRIAAIAHAVDALMLVPTVFMGVNLIRGRSPGGT